MELGCGTAYVSGWLSRRGALEVVGIDNSEAQLRTARRLAREHGVVLTLIHGNAETRLPYPDGHFDFAISDYGAAIWCDPALWIAEAHRVLTPGGKLVFLGHTPLLQICTPADGASADATLHRDYFSSIRRSDWSQTETDPGGVEFNLPLSAWLRLFRETGFEVEDFVELRAPEGSADKYGVPRAWAQLWPAEMAWKLVRL